MNKYKMQLISKQLNLEKTIDTENKEDCSNYIDLKVLNQEKLEQQKNKKDIKPDILISGWIIYIIIMIGGLIFNDYIFISIGSTIIFFSWRHHQIEIENGREYKD